MDSSSSSEEKTSKFSGKISSNTIALIICMGIAALLLLLNKLSNEYISDISASVTYDNLPEDKIVVKPLQSRLSLLVESTGFKLLMGKLRGPVTNVDVNLDLYNKADYILSDALKLQISNLLTTDYTLLDIRPDTIYFHFDKKVTKKVPIAPDHTITFEKQYDFIEPILIIPDSVTISGPQEIVEPIRTWKTEPLVLENLNQSTEIQIDLASPASNSIALSPDEVKFVIPVEKYTEQEIKINIDVINTPEKSEITIYPNKVRIIFKIGLSNYDKITEDQFRAVADFSEVDPETNQYVDIEIVKSPDFIKNLHYSPKSAEYIIIYN